jgi:hypothetical protein
MPVVTENYVASDALQVRRIQLVEDFLPLLALVGAVSVLKLGL